MALVRVKLADGTETTVGDGFAATHKLKVLDKPATYNGRAIRTKYPVNLRGAELDAALTAAGLSTAGTAKERRERLSDHQASPAIRVGESTATTEESA